MKVMYVLRSLDCGSRGKRSFLLQLTPVLSKRGTALRESVFEISLHFRSADSICRDQG